MNDYNETYPLPIISNVNMYSYNALILSISNKVKTSENNKINIFYRQSSGNIYIINEYNNIQGLFGQGFDSERNDKLLYIINPKHIHIDCYKIQNIPQIMLIH